MAKKLEINFEDMKINEVKQDINLMMFNSKQFSFSDMKLFNSLISEIEKMKLIIKY